MTLGEKIKEYRKIKKMSSNELANITGIHPVTIRKYETNKMVPGAVQVQKIAKALDVPPILFYGLENAKLNPEVPSQFLSILIILYYSKILNVNGERDDNGKLIKDTVTFSVSPIIEEYFQFEGLEKNSLSKIQGNFISNTLLEDFILWEYWTIKTHEIASNTHNEEELLEKDNSMIENFISTLPSSITNLAFYDEVREKHLAQKKQK